MATRIVFLNGEETMVTETEDQVVQAVRRDHPNPVKLEGVDDHGLDELDRNFLSTIIRIYNGGPVGVEAIAATLNEEVDTLVDMVEPFLLQQGFVSRTKSGRKANEAAYRLLNLPMPGTATRSLFE